MKAKDFHIEDLTNDQFINLQELAEEMGYSDAKKYIHYMMAEELLTGTPYIEIIIRKIAVKRKKRHNPNKKQNKYDEWCSYCDDIGDRLICMCGYSTEKCQGNPHNCVKSQYHDAASIKTKVGSDKKRKI